MSTNSFAGTWRLVSGEVRNASGEVSYPFGKDATGYLMYSDDGRIAVAIMQANRTNFASADLQAASAEEKTAAFETYISYCGTYEVRDDKVIHHVELSLFPNWSKTDLERFFEFSGDQLDLRTPPIEMGGTDQTAHLIWQRATPR